MVDTPQQPYDPEQVKEQILTEHRDNPHPEIAPGALKPHLLIHAMVEKQLAENDPPETRQALERLMDKGFSRHQATHKIGEVVAREAMAMLRDKRELDRTAFAQDLAKLV